MKMDFFGGILPGTKLEFGFLEDQFLLRCFLVEIYRDNESDERKLKIIF